MASLSEGEKCDMTSQSSDKKDDHRKTWIIDAKKTLQKLQAIQIVLEQPLKSMF